LIASRDDILGPPELMTLDRPKPDEHGNLVGGTHFERLGQLTVKESRCISMTMTCQQAPGIVGPAAGCKVYPDDPDRVENARIRKAANTVIYLLICLFFQY
jgi:hypothetical protein